ncbi:hypothetical protein ZIOFF_064224 [Zingiber officinale]|uniref:Remorin C-terminal domain-containing protein n=1 Tax=Zingiber officinale TaxID=94328 RepID=A0A8J5CI35_ZINOF|nr:hypothetical protein ZIOFF_064224 [Zingiber officinale]
MLGASVTRPPLPSSSLPSCGHHIQRPNAAPRLASFAICHSPSLSIRPRNPCTAASGATPVASVGHLGPSPALLPEAARLRRLPPPTDATSGDHNLHLLYSHRPPGSRLFWRLPPPTDVTSSGCHLHLLHSRRPPGSHHLVDVTGIGGQAIKLHSLLLLDHFQAAHLHLQSESHCKTVKDVEEEKAAIVPAPEEKPDVSKPLADVLKIEEPSADYGSTDRGATLARVLTEKRLSLIKAWEENEKVKTENKAVQKIADIVAWENSKKAGVEAAHKKKEEELEKKKAQYAEKVKNKIASIHKEAEAKKANVEVKRGEEVLKTEETAGKYRSAGFAPKRIWGFLGG